MISSVLVLSGCLAASPPRDAKPQEDKKEEDKREDPAEEYRGRGTWGEERPVEFVYHDTPAAADTGEEPAGEAAPSPCPKDQARMEDGHCAPTEEFFQEQEILDAQAIAEIQHADTPKQQAEAAGAYIHQQTKQIEQAEKDLDEIIGELKKKKKSKAMAEMPGMDKKMEDRG